MKKDCPYSRDDFVLVEVLDSVLEGLMFVKFPTDVKKCLEALQDSVNNVINDCEDVYYEYF